MLLRFLLLALALGLAAVSCRREEGPRPRTPTPLDLSTVGRIDGEVRLEGEAPPETMLSLRSDAECSRLRGAEVPAGDVLVRDGKVQNAIVYIARGLEGRVFPVPEEPVVIDQKDCLFVPRVTAARVGQPIRFLNSDAFLHNVRAEPGRARGWNFSLAVRGAARTVYVNEEDPVIVIRCDVHPWMKAFLGVFDHPYFAVTGADGKFSFENVPPGDYTLVAWHERLGRKESHVSLPPKGSVRAEFVFRAAEG
ncbi:MAG: hypothetical protein KatS3mg076_2852 [Candidatus Binatia bacterium]|nr:MAG: hypothetical protein KatS3mg076_2852 [Candidatus Binatia bacterium]